MRNFLFLTSTNLATNPRLVKEICLARAQGDKVTVLFFYFNNWSEEADHTLRATMKDVRFIQLSAIRSPFLPWLISSVLEKFFRFIPVSLLNRSMLSIAVGKRSFLLLKKLNHLNEGFDWVIAHNPATFYAAMVAAQKFKSKLGIDIEDYHPGETHNVKAAERVRKLMSLVLPKANYSSYASPLIMKEVEKDVPGLNTNQLVIINSFSGDEFFKPVPSQIETLKMVWFSQNIDANRGLENLIPAVNELYPAVELHLIGNLRPAFEAAYLQNKTGICLHAPKPQKELHRFLSTCDVGLALEPGKDLNNQLAISNKLIACVQAGLYILAFDTPAQIDFLSGKELHYQIVGNRKELIKETIMKLDTTKIRAGKEHRFITGKLYDWHQLSRPLVEVWNRF